MNNEELKIRVGANIARLRKSRGLTQAELAERINYSDKAVSKWERGESIPDVLTLVSLAELFGITVNDLIVDPNALPEDNDPGKLEKAMTQVSEKALKRKANKNVILALSTTLVWFVALLVFVVLSSIPLLDPYSWLIFFYAVPANAIVLLSLRSAWRDFRWNKILISTIAWGSLLSVYVSLRVFFNLNIWKLFLLGIPGQIAIFLWFHLFRPMKGDKQEAEHE
jgi:transcriptional regulator with XRE-family HTH domain